MSDGRWLIGRSALRSIDVGAFASGRASTVLCEWCRYLNRFRRRVVLELRARERLSGRASQRLCDIVVRDKRELLVWGLVNSHAHFTLVHAGAKDVRYSQLV